MTARSFKKVLITGIAGSGGSYLAEYIHDKHPDVEIHGIVRWHSTSDLGNLHRIKDKIRLYEGDLLDLGSVIKILREVQPEAIFHLASFANVRASFDTPLSVLNTNILGSANLFDAVRILGLNTWVQHCSTSEVYGQVDPKYVPINETCPFNPASPYAVSKTAQDLLARSYFVSYKLNMVRTRAFTYVNPRRGDLFATSFARQIALIEAGKQERLNHGNLDSVRTIIDARDMMEAYWLALTHGEAGEVYNIGGDYQASVGDVLKTLIKNAQTKIPLFQDPHLMRPSDVTLQIPDTSKFKKLTGWKPKYSVEESLIHLLEVSRQWAKNQNN